MSLALELQIGTVAELKARMSEGELVQWYQHARKHGGLPSRRLELALANVARVSSGSESHIAAFVFDPSLRKWLEPDTPTSAEDAATALTALVGGPGVYKLGERKIADIMRQANGR